MTRGLSGDAGTAFYEALLSRLRATSGVVSAGGARPTVPQPGLEDLLAWRRAGCRCDNDERRRWVLRNTGTPISAGREFIDTIAFPRTGSRLTAMLWPDQNPEGEPVIWGPSRVPSKVVGVVDMPRCQNIGADPGPCGSSPSRLRNLSCYLHVRTVGEPLAFAPTLRTRPHELNPDVALASEVTLDTLLYQLIGRQRAAALASAGLASFGIVLVAVGCVSLFVSMVPREPARDRHPHGAWSEPPGADRTDDFCSRST